MAKEVAEGRLMAGSSREKVVLGGWCPRSVPRKIPGNMAMFQTGGEPAAMDRRADRTLSQLNIYNRINT